MCTIHIQECKYHALSYLQTQCRFFKLQLTARQKDRALQSSSNLQFTPVLQQHHGLKSLTQQLSEVGFILGMKEGEDPKKIFSFPGSVLVPQILSQIT